MKVINWDKWQTFRKDRGTPPWIKVYRNLLSNEEWVDLTDEEKGQLVSIWLLAADKDGEISDNPKMIQRMAMLDSEPNINKFIELEFLVSTCQPHGNHKSNSCPQHDAPEKSREEKRRVEKSREDPDDDNSDHPVWQWTPSKNITTELTSRFKIPQEFVDEKLSEFRAYRAGIEVDGRYQNYDAKFMSDAQRNWKKIGHSWTVSPDHQMKSVMDYGGFDLEGNYDDYGNKIDE